MPEGPEIWRVAQRLHAALGGRRLTAIFFGLPSLAGCEARFTDARVEWVASRGKALLTAFDNGLTIYSHNQLYGRWELLEAGQPPPETRRQLRLALHTDCASALLYSASEIEVLDAGALERHPFLSRLGPDLLAPDTSLARLRERLRSPTFARRRLGGLLSDQSFVAGIGNYLRCEILFSAGLHPARAPRTLDDEALERLVAAMLELPRQSAASGGVTNPLARYEALRHAGADFETARFQVFRRAGLPCYRCGATVLRLPSGGQPCYLCPACQPAP